MPEHRFLELGGWIWKTLEIILKSVLKKVDGMMSPWTNTKFEISKKVTCTSSWKKQASYVNLL